MKIRNAHGASPRPGDDRDARTVWLSAVRESGLMFAAVFALCVVSLAIPRALHTDVLVWPVNAIIIALTLKAGRRRFVLLLAAAWVGDAAASLWAGESVWMAAVLSSCNIAAVAVSWLGVRRYVGSSDRIFESQGLWRFLVICGGVAPLASTVIAALALGGLDRPRTWILLGEWTIANGLGSVVFVPMVLVATSARRRLAAAPITPRAAAALVGLAVLSAGVFAVDYRYAFLLFPIFILVVFEAEVLGAAAGSLLIIVTGIGAEILRRGALGQNGVISDADMLGAQMFLAAITLVGLPIATTLEQRRALRTRLAESEENYRGLTEASEDLVTRIDLDGAITFASRASTSFGYAVGALVGRRFEDLVFPEDRDRVAAFLSTLQAGRAGDPTAGQIEFRLAEPSGDARWVEAKAGVVANAHGVAVAVVMVLRDVTGRKLYEAELAAARSESEAAARIKAEFLANMSHELRTPLTSVIGFTQLVLREPGLSNVAVEYLDKAVSAGSLLLSIINDVLDYSKIEAGHVTIDRQPTSAQDMVRRATELFSEPAQDKGLILRTELDMPADAEILVDPHRVAQILLNLVANAVKFSPEGEVLVRAAWSPADPVLRIAVQDHGPGIAAEDQDKLFKRFSQLDQAARPSVGGTGLGLAICYGLAVAMGGRIGVVSEKGHGARFWFEIPAPAATGAAPEAAAHDAVDLTGMRILIADDHPENRELVRAILQPFGASVVEAAGGEQAVQVARATPFDLILMDLLMPGTDGAAALRTIRATDGPNRTAPVVAFSAGLDALTAGPLSAEGFDDGLSKPILPASLLQLVLKYAPDAVGAE